MINTKPENSVILRLGPSVVDDVRMIRKQLDEEAGHDLHTLAENARHSAIQFRLRQPQEMNAERIEKNSL